MNKRITFKNLEHSTAIEEFANKHLEKIEALLETERTPVSINMVIHGFKTHAHNNVEIIVSTPDYDLIAHHEGPDIFKEINTVLDKMVQEIRRAKEKRADMEKKKDFFKGV